MKTRILLIVLLLALAAGGGGYFWWRAQHRAEPKDLALYGNVDLREISLAFNNSERIAQVAVQEGDRVKKGQLLAALDARRLEPQVDQAAAMADAQRHVVERMHNGTRPEEIAQDRANVDSAKADEVNAHLQYDRVKSAFGNSDGKVVSRQEMDSAQATLASAQAKLQVNVKALELALAGPRKEDVAQAEAQLRADEAQTAFLRQQLEDARLLAPQDAVIRSRLLEPGDMASPQKPVFTLAIVDPKWVRVYASEPDLGKIRLGMKATVQVDGFPNRNFEAWVGFISPSAEFTPKSVQTTELRSSLVYEVRVFVKDPDDLLHLGMPATVRVPLQHPSGPDGPPVLSSNATPPRSLDASR